MNFGYSSCAYTGLSKLAGYKFTDNFSANAHRLFDANHIWRIESVFHRIFNT